MAIFIPYSKGFMLSFLRRAASEALIFFPLVQTLKSLVISICPLTILVEMLRAWKKLIWEGSRPVAPAGQVKSMGETTPTLASVGTLLASILPLSSWTLASLKMSATFCLRKGIKTLSSGILPPNCYSRCLNSSSWMPSTLIWMTFLTRV